MMVPVSLNPVSEEAVKDQNATSSTPRQLIRTKDVLSLLAISRTTLHRLRESDRTFPKPIKDGSARSAPMYYVLAEVEAWVQRRMDQRDGDPKCQA